MTPDAIQIAIARYTLALVVVGGLQVVGLLVQAYFLYRALNANTRAALANEQAARATTDTVKIALEAQRAQLMMNVKNPIVGFQVGEKPYPACDLRNVGTTVAYNTSYETWIEIIKLPFVDFSPAADYYKVPNTLAVYPRDTMPIFIGIELQKPLTAQEAIDIYQNKTFWLCFRIRLTWTDAFGESHWADFGYCFDGQRVGALPKYNDAG